MTVPRARSGGVLVPSFRSDDHVDMTGHNAPSIYFQAFISLAMFPAVEYYFLVFISDK